MTRGPFPALVLAAREWREAKYPLVSAIDQVRDRIAVPSKAELDEFARIRDRITAMTLMPNLPRDVWSQLCNLDTDMARAIGSARVPDELLRFHTAIVFGANDVELARGPFTSDWPGGQRRARMIADQTATVEFVRMLDKDGNEICVLRVGPEGRYMFAGHDYDVDILSTSKGQEP